MGSGGGSASGRTDFPEYMKDYHSVMLRGVGYGDIDSPIEFSLSVVDAFNEAATGPSPYFAYTSNQLVPDTMFFPTGKTIAHASYAKPFDLLAKLTDSDFEQMISDNQTPVANTAWVNSLIAAQTATLDDEISLGVGPKFHANMRDIGAVMSSAFVIGDAIIQDSKLKALAKTRLEVEQLAMQRQELAIKTVQVISSLRQITANSSMDFVKLYHAIREEANDTNAEWLAKDLLWDLKLFQYAANPLGAIAGSALNVDHGKGSKAGNAVGGALAGAAGGAMVGGVPGALIGGVIGLAGGLFS